MDTEERLVGSSDYRYALNCRILSSDGDNVGIVENTKGNKQLSNFLDDEKYVVIGCYENKQSNSLFYFVCDTVDSNHKIMSNFYNGNFYIIAEGYFLNFNENHLITGVNLIIDDIDYPHGVLYWTDDFNEPRKLDVERALNSTQNISTGQQYETIDSDVIKAILPPPVFYPICSLGKDENKKDVNYIKRNVWQFKYRWVYKNNGKSAWSPISDITMTRTGTPDRKTFNLEEQNIINIRVNTGSDEVKNIEIAARKYNLKEDFKLVKTIEKGKNYPDVYLTVQPNVTSISTSVITDNNEDIYYIFSNSEITTPLPLQETNRLFDDVPLLAKSQELIDGNRLVYGNIVNGYNPVETDVKFKTVYQDIEEQKTYVIKPKLHFSSGIHIHCEQVSPVYGQRIRESAGFTLDFSSIDWSQIPAGADVDIQVDKVCFGANYHRDGNLFYSKKHAEFIGYIEIPNITTQWQAGWTDFSDVYNWFINNFQIKIKGIAHDYDGIELRLYSNIYSTNCNSSAPSNSVVNQDLFDSTNVIYSNSDSQDFVANTSSAVSTERLRIGFMIANIDTLPFVSPALDGDVSLKSSSLTVANLVLDQISASSIPQTIAENNCEFIWFDEPVDEERGFKSGAEHGFGIVYYDRENRSGAVNKCPEAYIPWNLHRNMEQNSTLTPNIFRAPASIQFEINHAPPEWATHYQFVYSGARSIDKFVQFHAEEFAVDTAFVTAYESVLPDSLTEVGSNGAGTFPSLIPHPNATSVIKVNVSGLIKRKSRSNLDDMMWTWQKGDRLRFVEFPNFIAGKSIIDFEIIGVDEEIDGTASNSNLWYILDEQAYDELNLIVGSLSDVLIEIYRPNNSEEEVFYYEFGHMNPIIGGNHSVENAIDNIEYLQDYYEIPASLGVAPTQILQDYQTQDISTNTPAIGYFRFGDVHHRPREIHTASGFKSIEDSAFSDFFNSEGWGQGRPNAFLSDFKQTRRDSTIFYSEPYVANTNINGLGVFYPDVSFQEFDKRFNSIQKLYSINDSLIIFQEDKVSKSMVNRAVLFDATGEQNVAISNNILSPGVPYGGDYGICKNPESFASFGFRSYFFDVRRGAVMRLSQDGLTPISEANMKNFFTDYCQEVMENRKLGKLKCFGVYDDKFDEYIISTHKIQWSVYNPNGGGIGGYDHFNIPGFTVGFNETGKRWNSFYSFIPDYMCSYNTGIISFKNGDPWIHNSDMLSNYNTFYGTTYSSIVDIISNVEPTTNKIYNTISQESTDIWEATLNTRNGQETTVSINEFTGGQSFVWEEGHGTKENVHHAVIMGDVNSVGGKIEGNRMRDTSINVRLTLPVGPAQEENTLFSVNFGISPSGSPNLIGNV